MSRPNNGLWHCADCIEKCYYIVDKINEYVFLFCAPGYEICPCVEGRILNSTCVVSFLLKELTNVLVYLLLFRNIASNKHVNLQYQFGQWDSKRTENADFLLLSTHITEQI